MKLKLASIVILVAVAGLLVVLWTTDDRPGEPLAPEDIERPLSRPTVDAAANPAEVVREEAPVEAPTTAPVHDPARAGLVGTVDQTTGELIPLSGARVTVLTRDRRTGKFVHSDEQGAFHVPEEVPQDGSRWLLAELQGYAAHHVRFKKDVAPILRMVPSAVIYGRVVNKETENPIAGATVRHHGGHDSLIESMLTDASGNYRFDDVPSSGRFAFQVQPPNGSPVRLYLDPDGPGEYRKDVAISLGPLIRGLATDLETGQPIAGAEVSIDFSPVTHTDAAGTFELFMPPDRKIMLVVTAEGYCTSIRKFDPALMSGEQETRIPLVRACSVKGLVLDIEGQPLKNVRVSSGKIRSDGTRNGRSSLQSAVPEGIQINSGSTAPCRTDQEGQFVLTGLLPFTVYESIEVYDHRTNRKATAGPFSFTQSGETLSTTVRFQIAAEVHGRVTWNGEGMRAFISAVGHDVWTVTDDDGRYHLELTEVGPVKLYASAMYERFTEAEEIHLAPGERRQLDFAFEGELNRVEGRILSSSGQPVPRVTVVLRWDDRQYRGCASGEDGRFTANLPLSQGQTYTLHLNHGPAHVRRDELVVGGPPVDIVLPDLGKALLKVVDADSGVSLTDVHLEWRQSGTDTFRGLRIAFVNHRPDGSLVLTLPAGLVDVRVKHRKSDGPGVTAANVHSSIIPGSTPVVVRLPSN